MGIMGSMGIMGRIGSKYLICNKAHNFIKFQPIQLSQHLPLPNSLFHG